jgi:hypothetical protein
MARGNEDVDNRVSAEEISTADWSPESDNEESNEEIYGLSPEGYSTIDLLDRAENIIPEYPSVPSGDLQQLTITIKIPGGNNPNLSSKDLAELSELKTVPSPENIAELIIQNKGDITNHDTNIMDSKLGHLLWDGIQNAATGSPGDRQSKISRQARIDQYLGEVSAKLKEKNIPIEFEFALSGIDGNPPADGVVIASEQNINGKQETKAISDTKNLKELGLQDEAENPLSQKSIEDLSNRLNEQIKSGFNNKENEEATRALIKDILKAGQAAHQQWGNYGLEKLASSINESTPENSYLKFSDNPDLSVSLWQKEPDGSEHALFLSYDKNVNLTMPLLKPEDNAPQSLVERWKEEATGEQPFSDPNAIAKIQEGLLEHAEKAYLDGGKEFMSQYLERWLTATNEELIQHAANVSDEVNPKKVLGPDDMWHDAEPSNPELKDLAEKSPTELSNDERDKLLTLLGQEAYKYGSQKSLGQFEYDINKLVRDYQLPNDLRINFNSQSDGKLEIATQQWSINVEVSPFSTPINRLTDISSTSFTTMTFSEIEDVYQQLKEEK